MKPFHTRKKDLRANFLALIGVIKPSQNIETVLEYMYKNPSWNLKLIGVCERNYYQKLREFIFQHSLEQRVWFPNKFIPDKQLQTELDDCLIGLALYKVGRTQFTWYTDPGKIKTYLEFGLPVIMTDTSSIVKDITTFHCGEVIKGRPLDFYINKVMANYSSYQKGVRNMVHYYEYLKYYDDRFIALRN
jgi:glycosyltransferase involved in cell wall biosynthesis